MQRTFTRGLAALLLCVSLPGLAAAQSQPRDTDNNAMVRGGAYTKQELVQKLNNGDGRHTGAFLTRDFSRRGVTVAEIQSADTVEGTVTDNGRIIVGGRTVATGARSYGRTNMPGSRQEGNLYSRPTSVSFASSSLPAFVYMPDGRFEYAIIKSCGNLTTATARPVAAVAQPVMTPVPQPSPTPAPTPAPTHITVVQTQKQTQVQANAAPTKQPAPQRVQPVVAKSAPVLPETGTSLMALAALSAMIVAAWYYQRSRRAFRAAVMAQPTIRH